MYIYASKNLISKKKMSQKYIFNPRNLLDNVGTSLSDFEEVKEGDIGFSILGKGNFGYAEKMKSKKNPIFYAIKKLDKKKNNKNIYFKRETELSIKLDHPNIIKLYGYFEDIERIDKFKFVYRNDKKKKVTGNEDKEIYCLVLEFAENGSLKYFFKDYKEKNKTEKSFNPIPQETIIKMLKQCLDALKYLHAKGIIHRDISLDNILLGINNIIKISDFGISAQFYEKNDDDDNDNNDDDDDNDKKNEKKTLDDKSLYSKFTIVGRKDMAPPEIEDETCYDHRLDIFCLGLVFLILISEKYPIEIKRNENNEFIGKIIHEEYIFETYNQYLIKLVKRMLEREIFLRPTSEQCYEELEYIEKIIDNPDDENAKMYLEERNKPLSDNIYKKKAGSEIHEFHNNKVYFIAHKSHKSKAKDKSSTNPNDNSNVNNCSNSNNTNFNNYGNCSNNNLNNNNNQNFNNNINNNIYNNQNFNININNNINNNQNFNININNNIYNNQNFNNLNYNINNNQNFNNFNYNINNNQNFNNNINYINNNQNLNTNFINNNYRRNSFSYSWQNQISYINNHYYNNNQSKLHNMSNNNLLDQFKYDTFRDMQAMMMNLNINASISSSLVSALQCSSACLERYNLQKNLKFLQEHLIKDSIFLLDLANIFERLSKISQNEHDKIDFTNYIQNFSKKAKSLNCSFETDENNPFQVLLHFFNYLNGEYSKNESSYKNNTFRDVTEFDILPKDKFGHIYDTINSYTKYMNSPVADAFYYILLQLTRCPTCNKVLKAEDDISFFIPVPGSSLDKISNQVNNYLNSQKYSNENYKCQNCSYKGPGKIEKDFLNNPKYLLINIEGKDK